MTRVLFHDESDRQIFLLECGKRIDETDTANDHGQFIQRRNKLLGYFKNFQSSQNTKQAWATNRYKFMWAIRKYANSLEGRKFHRQLGRFLATRLFIPKNQGIFGYANERYDTLESIRLSNTDLINCRKMLLLERQYFHTLSEQLEIELLIEFLDAEISHISK